MISGLTLPFAAVLASNACSLAAILLLFNLVKGIWGSDTATAATAIFSFFPASLFLSAGYSEGPALLLTVGFFILLLRRRFALAAVCAGCMSAARPTEVLLAVPLGYEIWEHFKRRLSSPDMPDTRSRFGGENSEKTTGR
jgi:Gpi18-like mannosyltransferase